MRITYRFLFRDNRVETFDLLFHPETMELVGPKPDALPKWTRLEWYQCKGCPLEKSEMPHCPLAVAISELVECFDGLVSHEELKLEVATPGRTISSQTSVQRAVSSMMGLVIPTCGCPRTAHFKPMARNHLPLADSMETLYRAVSMYLLGQYLRKNRGEEADCSLEGLKKIYAGMEDVNMGIARRLRTASETDSSVNAIVLLDVFAKTMPFAIDDGLVEIKSLYSAYFD